MAEEAENDKRPRQGQNRVYGGYRRPCRTRLEELALPSKRLILNLWQDHAYHFEPVRRKNVLHAVEELYSLTPE